MRALPPRATWRGRLVSPYSMRMRDRRLTDAAKTQLVEAVKTVESVSSVEVVVCVRKRSAAYAETSLGSALVVSTLMLAYELYAPQPFALHWMLINPLMLAALTWGLVVSLPPLQRALTRASRRRTAALASARAAFFELGVRRTRDRIGVLLFFSQLERELVVLVDDGVRDAIPEGVLEDLIKALETPYRADQGLLAAARALAVAGETFATHLPVAEDDVNELGDEVRHG